MLVEKLLQKIVDEGMEKEGHQSSLHIVAVTAR